MYEIVKNIQALKYALGDRYGSNYEHITITLARELFDKFSLDFLCEVRYGNQDLNKELTSLYICGVEIKRGQ